MYRLIHYLKISIVMFLVQIKYICVSVCRILSEILVVEHGISMGSILFLVILISTQRHCNKQIFKFQTNNYTVPLIYASLVNLFDRLFIFSWINPDILHDKFLLGDNKNLSECEINCFFFLFFFTCDMAFSLNVHPWMANYWLIRMCIIHIHVICDGFLRYQW